MVLTSGAAQAAPAATAASPPGATASTPATSDPTETEAQARFEEGLKRVKAGDFGAARVSFEQAYAVLHRPRILWNLALCEEKTGRLVDALTHFKQVARDSAASESDRGNAQLHVDGLASKTGHVEVQAPPGVALTVDGESLSAATPLPEPLDVSVGHHVIEARLAQGVQSMAVDAVAGEVTHVTFRAPDAGDTSGSGGPNLMPPVAPVGPSPGMNSAGVESSDTTPRATARGPRIATVAILGGAAVAAVALGAYFGVQSQHDADTAADFRSTHSKSACVSPVGAAIVTCSQWNKAVSAQNREFVEAAAFYTGGGVLAAGAIFTWLLWPRTTERTGAAPWVLPLIGPGMAGLSAGGNF